jgi:hypothetical protein
MSDRLGGVNLRPVSHSGGSDKHGAPPSREACGDGGQQLTDVVVMREQSGSILRGLEPKQQSTESEIQSDVPLQDSSSPLLVEVPSLGGLLTSQLSGSSVVAATVS